MSWLVALAIGSVLAAGVYLLLSRALLRVVVGVTLLGSAVNLMIFTSGRLGPTAPPVVESGEQALLDAANPLPQALLLTAIVIGFALSCFSLVLALGLKQVAGEGDVNALQASEPPAGADGKPAVLDEDAP